MINSQSRFIKRTVESAIHVDVRDSDKYTNLVHLQITTSSDDHYQHQVSGTPLKVFLTPTELRELTNILARSQNLLVMPASDIKEVARILEGEQDTLPSDVNPSVLVGNPPYGVFK